jgi:benzoyl-CoA reductase/2-hydroxyglutaryl-CoA dehydratase subunit BcrC/BadD/HgdB
LVDQALSGDLDGLAGMAFAQTCDTVQALTDIWRGAVPHVSVYHLGMPQRLETQSAQSLLIAELNLLRRALDDPSDDALWHSFAVYNRTRVLMRQLYDRAADLPPTDLYAALRASFLMPKEEYNDLLNRFLDDLPRSEFLGPRLILVGPHLADPVVYQIIEATGGRIADDLLDIGRRYQSIRLVGDGDPVASLADRLLAALPTPTKYHPQLRRAGILLERVIHSRADGVVFARQKFCDPHGFDYAYLVSALKGQGIPHLLVELEQTSPAGQLRTRIEAFLETLPGWEPDARI